MDGLELVSFKIISAVGMAKSSFIEAMKVAANGEFDVARAKIKEGEESFNGGHLAHSELIQQEASELIQQEASGNHVVPSILLMHAEDQLMSAETIKVMALEIIRLNERVKALEKY